MEVRETNNCGRRPWKRSCVLELLTTARSATAVVTLMRGQQHHYEDEGNRGGRGTIAVCSQFNNASEAEMHQVARVWIVTDAKVGKIMFQW